MKKIILALFITLGLNINAFNVMAHSSDDDDDFPVGAIKRELLTQEPHKKWFEEEYNDYIPDETVLNEINDKLNGSKKSFHIKVFMGTWCHDSRREVPRFYKILDQLNNPKLSSEIFALNYKKNTPDNQGKAHKIKNTPTFVLFKDGKQKKRIVESSVESLEKDLLKIISGQRYKHSKE